MNTEAFKQGWAARGIGMGYNSNPYDETLEATSYNQWMSGWATRQNSACSLYTFPGSQS